MQIDTTNLVKFGDMTSGLGLSGIFDGSTDTIGYSEKTTGYAGVKLSTPCPIGKVSISSASNGFDASGSTSPIRLRVFGKTGPAPQHRVDGVVLAELSFTDQNIVRTITLESTDIYTNFEYVWVAVDTNIWCILSDVSIFKADVEASFPLVPTSNTECFIKSCNKPTPLAYYGKEIPEFRVRFSTTEKRKLLIDFHADVVHMGTTGNDSNAAVGFSFRVCYRSANSPASIGSMPFLERRNAVGGGNVLNLGQHYGNKSIVDTFELEAGFHEISIIGSGHTSASSTPDLIRLLVEGGFGLNGLRVVVLP